MRNGKYRFHATDLRDFFPQEYFEDSPSFEEVSPQTCWYQADFIGEIERKERAKWREAERKRRLRSNPPKPKKPRKVEEVHISPTRVNPTFKKPTRYPYLPNPSFPLVVDAGVCEPSGLTWVCKKGRSKWVLLQRRVLVKVVMALDKKGYQQYGDSSFFHPYDDSIRTVKIFNFFDPEMGRQDNRFFWINVSTA